MRARELPSLNLLPALEAAARLGSFKDSAKELHLTPSAISQQIRALEAELGARLFVRDGRRVKLTRQGESYAREVRQALSELADASHRLRVRAREEAHVLTLNTLDFVAYEFLLPRLPRFRERFPGVELRMQTSVSLVDLRVSEVDVVIRVGGALWPGCHTEPFGSLTGAMVASPAIARKLRKPEQVLAYPLLELRGQEHRGWHALVEAAGRSAGKPVIVTFETYFETLRAAEHGQGIAFGLFPLTNDWVRSGRLALPFAIRKPLPGSISLLSRASEAKRPLYGRFLTWLREEYSALGEVPTGRVVTSARHTRGAPVALSR
jgi:LysR family glycine cleavage system transcriptional activator